MKMKCIIPKNTAGGKRKNGAHNHTEGEANISNMPRYIGFRENRNGPDWLNLPLPSPSPPFV